MILFALREEIYVKSHWERIYEIEKLHTFLDGSIFSMALNPKHRDYFKTSDGQKVKQQLDSMQFEEIEINAGIKAFQKQKYRRYEDEDEDDESYQFDLPMITNDIVTI